MGVIEDTANKSKLAKLLRFKSSKSKGDYVSLEEYQKNMKEWQKDIYYISGESIKAIKKSPFLEMASKKDVEVLYLPDPLDECKFSFSSFSSDCTIMLLWFSLLSNELMINVVRSY